MKAFLEEHGWRRISTQKQRYGRVHYWDHPNHQPARRGAFTTTGAFLHQKESERAGCDCIKADGSQTLECP